MAESALSVPVRSALSKAFPLVIVALLIVSAGSGYVAYNAHFEEETTTEQQTTGTWSVHSDFAHSATVQRDSAVFSAGERLEDRRLYFTSVTPELDGQYILNHDSSDGDPAFVTAELRLVLRAVEEIDGEEVVHWEESEVIAIEEEEIADEDSFVVEFDADVPALQERLEAIEDDLEASPGTTEVLVRTDAAIEGSAGGESFTETRTETLTIDVSGATYSVESDSAEPAPYEATESTTVVVEPSPLETYGSVGIGVIGLLLIVGLLIGRWRGTFTISDAERARYEFEAAKSDFSEWITPGDISDDDDYRTVRVSSLQSVVDVAIDGNRRVLETPAGRYVVLLEDKKYVYEPDVEIGLVGESVETESSADEAASPDDATEPPADSEGKTDVADM